MTLHHTRSYEPKTRRLWAGREPTPFERDEIARACRQLQSDMLDFAASPNRVKKRIVSGNIYFVTDGSAVKIGFAQDVKRRIFSLQTCNPHTLSLLGSMPGCISDDYLVRQKFRHHRLRGDWYRLEGDLMSFIVGLSEL